MRTIKVKFNGRKENAIGIFYPITLTLKVPDNYKTIHIISAIREKGYETNHLLSF